MMKMLTLYLALLNLAFTLIWAFHQDKVTSLPGVNFSLPFNHYAGYLEALDGNQFFYWFFESERDSTKDPVILWLNGGPGCSSMLGALTENGPLKLVKNLSLELNRFAWNTRASVLYLESPAEVGFSYNPRHNSSADDNWTAENNFVALQSFFKKFPHLQENEFYITGESYGGIYVPTLSMLVLQNKFPVNFRGFALGNGYMDEKLNDNSEKQFFYHHGFIDENTWELLIDSCCANVTNIRHCDFMGNANRFEQCAKIYLNISEMILNYQTQHLEDPYNIYNTQRQEFSQALWRKDFRELQQIRYNKAKFLEEDSPIPGGDTLAAYLNQPSVREALHIRHESPPKWTSCNMDLNRYHYKKTYQSVMKQVKHLLESGLKGLIYNGDLDSVCNFLGDMWFSEKLGFPILRPLQPWMVERYGMSGMVKQFEHFYYVTVRGAGHMVPTDRPAQAQNMIYKFLIDA